DDAADDGDAHGNHSRPDWALLLSVNRTGPPATTRFAGRMDGRPVSCHDGASTRPHQPVAPRVRRAGGVRPLFDAAPSHRGLNRGLTPPLAYPGREFPRERQSGVLASSSCRVTV